MAIGKYKVRRDRRLYVDFELTCSNDPPSEPVRPEIIEIGIAELDLASLQIVRSESYYVKNIFSPVTEKCTQLTGITQKILDKQGRPLAEVCGTVMKKFGSGNKAWASWGSDKEAIDRDCTDKGIVSPFSEAFFNIGLDYSQMTGLDRSVGLHDALHMLGDQAVTEHHRAVNDAIEAARVDIIRMRLQRAAVDLAYFDTSAAPKLG